MRLHRQSTERRVRRTLAEKEPSPPKPEQRIRGTDGPGRLDHGVVAVLASMAENRRTYAVSVEAGAPIGSERAVDIHAHPPRDG